MSFTPLSAGFRQIPPSELSYNFVKFTSLNHNSVFGGNQYVYAPSRPAPDDFPDGLSNDRSTTVAANRTQPIWVRVHVPKYVAGGVYRGAVRIETDHGTETLPLSVNVRPVTIPDAKDSGFTDVEWTLFFGTVSYQPPPSGVETMLANYGFSPFTPKWWKLMEDYADLRRDYRNNNLTLPMNTLLLAGNTTVDETGKVHFDFSKVDQVVKFFTDRGTVSRLEGFWVNAGPGYLTHWDVETLARDADGKTVKKNVVWTSPEADSFIKQYVAAVRDHVKAKGWASKWWMLLEFKVAGAPLPHENLVAGKTYTKSWVPPSGYPDSTGRESTDGVISDTWGDGRPYVIQGIAGETKSFDVSFDLGAPKTVREVDVQGYVEYSGYRPDTVRVLTSDDGEHWTDRGPVVTRPNDASGNRWLVRFDPVQAQHVKVAFTRTFTPSADGVFLDDIEVY